MDATHTTTETREQAAARDLEEARRGVEEVLELIKDADEEIGPEDFEAAESRAWFAQARFEGLERKKQEEAEQARKERIEALKERALALEPGRVRKLEEKARKGLDAYVAAGVAYRAELNEVIGELSTIGPLPDDLEIDLNPRGSGLAVGSERRAPVDPMAGCTLMAYDVLRTHMPRQEIDLPVERYR